MESNSDDFYEFLAIRGVSEEIINFFKSEGIDKNTLPFVEEADFKTWIPRLGDRLAITNFCKRSQNQKRKLSLLEKLSEKIQSKKPKIDSSSQPSTSTSNSDLTSSAILHKNKKTKNPNRIIYLGWILNQNGQTKQVRCADGGGSRKLPVSKCAIKRDLVELGIGIFFPNNNSTHGSVHQFDHDLVDFQKQPVIDENITIEAFYEQTGLPVLRLYLLSTRIEKLQEVPRIIRADSSAASQEEHRLLGEIIDDPDPIISEEGQLDKILHPRQDINDLEEVTIELSQTEYSFDDTEWNQQLLQATPFLNLMPEFENFQSEQQGNVLQPTVSDEPFVQEGESIDRPNSPYYIHRGNEFDELIEIFKTKRNSARMVVKMIQPNGEEEKGIDTGGVWRDCLTAFWNHFYLMCTEGIHVKVPCLRHDFQEVEWNTIAKILKIGWEEVQYFPVLLCPSFLKNMLFEKVGDLLEDFLNMLSDHDSQILKNALLQFPTEEDDFNDVLEVLDEYKLKKLPSKDNLREVLTELAHKEIIQKPSYILDIWRKELSGCIDETTYDDIQKNFVPSVKNVIKTLVCFDQGGESNATFSYLKKYIKEADFAKRSLFMRFCTGSNVVNKTIHVTFRQASSIFSRTPIAHVCSCELELDSAYTSYQEFRAEMDAVLTSNIWVMDFV